MAGRYAFTRISGAIVAGIGWVILGAQPIGLGLVLLVGAPPHATTPPLVRAAGVLIILVAGVLVGGVLIVAGQRLRLAVDSLHVQFAMLERLDELAAQGRDEPVVGRFSGLAGE